MTSISNETEFRTWVTSGSAGVVTLTSNITISTNETINVARNMLLEGGRYTITLPTSSTWPGLFTITSNNITMTVDNLLINATAVSGLSGINSSPFIAKIDNTGITVNITNCGVYGDLSTSISNTYSGGIMGRINGSNNTIAVTSCFSKMKFVGTGSGGILGGTSSATTNTITINKCYSIGDIHTSGGGIVGSYFGQGYPSGRALIKNCYSYGNMTNTGSSTSNVAGGIGGPWLGGLNTGGYVTIQNCYSFGTFASAYNAGISGYIQGGNVTIANCFSKNATGTGVGSNQLVYHRSGGSLSATDNQAGNGSWNVTLGTSLQNRPSDEINNVWLTTGDFSSGYGISAFNIPPWERNVAYTSNSSIPAFGDGEITGDPHIYTIFNESYDLISEKYFNLFDNNDTANRFVVNAMVEKPNYPIWKDKEYVSDVYFYFNGKECVVNLGFRGKHVIVAKNEIEENIITEEICVLNDGHTKFCSECMYRTCDDGLFARHRKNTNHYLLPNIRNKITMNINTGENKYTIVMANVDIDNFNPSRICLNPTNKNQYLIEKYDGAIVKKKDPYEHDIPTLSHIKQL